MTTTANHNAIQMVATKPPSAIFGKAFIAFYCIASYAIGVAGLASMILGMADILPMGAFFPLVANNWLATGFNLALTLLFGVQHSVMARPAYKRLFNSAMAKATERSTYVLMSGIVSLVVVGLWQPVDGLIWQIENALITGVVWCGFVFGWGYLLAATFAVNHWDLFGLRQMWFALKDREYEPPTFKESGMYRYSRHPIMLGVLIGMWSLPTMPATQFVFALTFTLYVFIGVAFEERDLIAQLGEQYIDYKRRVGMLLSFN